MIRRPPRSTLFPYTTLFRSRGTRMASDLLAKHRNQQIGAAIDDPGVLGEVRGCIDQDRKSTRLNSSHQIISYAVFCLKKKKTRTRHNITDRDNERYEKTINV